MTRRGCFIALEGADGTGKSTQCEMLAESLRERGEAVTVTREPGGTLVGDVIRELVLTPPEPLAPMAELLLFAAGRAQHVSALILPEIMAGRHVVCDRFLGSSIAYQGAGLGMGFQTVCDVNAFATGGLEPDLTIVIDVPVLVAEERRGREASAMTPDAIESRGGAFHERVREAYLSLSTYLTRPVLLLDGARAPEEVHGDIRAAVAQLIDRGRRDA